MKIVFLMHSVDKVGGITRATLTMASQLVDRGHTVQIAAMFRESERPGFDIDPRIDVVWLLESAEHSAMMSSEHWHTMSTTRSTVYPEGDAFRASSYSLLTDKLLRDYLHTCAADVILATSPGLNVCLAKYAPADAIVIGQEHLFHHHHIPALADKLLAAAARLDALVTVTEADAHVYRQKLGRYAHRVHFIPNPIPAPHPGLRECKERTIVAAGRLTEAKNFRMLIDAFATLHRHEPAWRLEIYGTGEEEEALGAQIRRLGLTNSAFLMGNLTPMDAAWARASIAAVSSNNESFGLTIVEAMRYGLPVVSTACQHGPPEIVSHGVDGFLTPVKDTDAFAEALLTLACEDTRRMEMSRAAVRKARRYEPDRIAAEYERLFRYLSERKRPTRTVHSRKVPTLQA